MPSGQINYVHRLCQTRRASYGRPHIPDLKLSDSARPTGAVEQRHIYSFLQYMRGHYVAELQGKKELRTECPLWNV